MCGKTQRCPDCGVALCLPDAAFFNGATVVCRRDFVAFVYRNGKPIGSPPYLLDDGTELKWAWFAEE